MDISPQKEVQQEMNEKIEKLQKNNSLIIDLKLKLDRVDFLLTSLLDFNNSNLFQDELAQNPVLISPEQYNKSQDLIIKLIGELSPIAERFYRKDK